MARALQEGDDRIERIWKEAALTHHLTYSGPGKHGELPVLQGQVRGIGVHAQPKAFGDGMNAYTVTEFRARFDPYPGLRLRVYPRFFAQISGRFR